MPLITGAVIADMQKTESRNNGLKLDTYYKVAGKMLLFSLRMPKICRQNILQDGLKTTQVGKM